MGKEHKVFISKERFKALLKEKGLTMRKVCDGCNLYYETIRPCISKQRIMPEDLFLIARYLDVSKEYLQGEADYPESYRVMESIKEMNDMRREGVIRHYLQYRLRASNYKFFDGTPVTEELMNEHELFVDAHISQYLDKLFSSVTPEYFELTNMTGEV